MTAVAGVVFSAAQFNTYVRDNLNTTAPAVATSAGNLIVTTGLNAVTQRIPTVTLLATSEGTTSNTFVNLTTSGPSVTVTHGVKAMLILGCQVSNASSGSGGRMGVDISGSNTQAASDINSFEAKSGNVSDAYQGSWVTLHNPLVAGSTTWLGKYKVVGVGTATFSNRLIAVVPF